jgi:hypothetical protein
VVANNIADYKYRATLVTQEPNTSEPAYVVTDNVVGTETEPIEVRNASLAEIKIQGAERSPTVTIDADLAAALIATHDGRIESR